MTRGGERTASIKEGYTSYCHWLGKRTVMTPYLFRGAAAAAVVFLLASPCPAQTDPGVRGGLDKTGGGLQAKGIPIPHPPVISPNPTTGATISPNERQSFLEGINRAGQLESTCDQC